MPHGTPSINKVFGNIHMLWMVRWSHHHATSTILVRQTFRGMVKLLDHSSGATNTNDVMVHEGKGPRPRWNDSHVHFKHIQGVWEHSHVVDG
jgi:hypothetical protein